MITHIESSENHDLPRKLLGQIRKSSITLNDNIYEEIMNLKDGSPTLRPGQKPFSVLYFLFNNFPSDWCISMPL